MLKRNERSYIGGDTVNVRVVESADSIRFVVRYLLENNLPVSDPEELELLNYYGVYKYDSYEIVYEKEKFMRDNLYNPEYADHEMNVDQYYQLVKLKTSQFIDKVKTYQGVHVKDNSELLFRKTEPIIRHHNSYHTPRTFELTGLQFLFTIAQKYNVNIFIAGGHIFNFIMRQDIKSDIDIFFVDCEPQDILMYIKEIALSFNQCNVKRTKNFISVEIPRVNEYQFILRIYKTRSEVIHGFDVDCCCIGYDGKSIFATQRCLFSIFNGYNTINFDLLSPSYEYRLAKYGNRGIAIKVPNFDRNKTHPRLLDQYHSASFERATELKKLYTAYHALQGLHNYQGIRNRIMDSIQRIKKPSNKNLKVKTKLKYLDLLLFLDVRCAMYRDLFICPAKINNLFTNYSDYEEYNPNGWVYVEQFCNYCYGGAQSFPGVWNKIILLSGMQPNYFDHYIMENRVPGIIRVKTKPQTLIISEIKASLNHARYNDNEESIDYLFHLGDFEFNIINQLGGELPQVPEFKRKNPGEQATNTFTRIILETPEQWYNGEFYNDGVDEGTIAMIIN